MDDEEEIPESEVKFCISCKSQKLQTTEDGDALICPVATCNFLLRKIGEDRDARGRLLEAAKKLGMKFCYSCGEELQEEEELLMCLSDEGCGMKFVAPKQPIPKLQDEASGLEDVIPEADVKCCITCGKGELKRLKKVLVCSGKKCKFKLQRGDDKEVHTKLQAAAKSFGMNYCYVCGEKLVLEEDGDKTCTGDDGCGMKFFECSVLLRPDPCDPSVIPKHTEVISPASLKSPEAGKRKSSFPNTESRRTPDSNAKQDSQLDGTLSESTEQTAAIIGDGSRDEPNSEDSLAGSTTGSSSDAWKTSDKSSQKTELKTTDEHPLEPGSKEAERTSTGTVVADPHNQEVSNEASFQSIKAKDKTDSEPPPDLNPKPVQNIIPDNESSTGIGESTNFEDVEDTEDFEILVNPADVSQLVSALKDIHDWRRLGTELGFSEGVLEEISGDILECKSKMLYQLFSTQDPSLSLFDELASAVERMGDVQAATNIRKQSQSFRVSLRGANSATLEEEVASITESFMMPDCTQTDPIANLMFPRPNPSIEGEKLERKVGKQHSRFKYTDLSYPTPLRECVKILFHAVIMVNDWGWNDDSSLYVRFGPKEIGEWKVDCGIFGEKSRGKLGKTEIVLEMEGVFYIPATLLKKHCSRGIAYKYVVYSQKVMNNEVLCWEHVPSQHTSKKHTNRCLVVDEAHRKAGDIHHQYDQILLPCAANESVFQRIGRWIQGSKHSTENYSMALEIYLYSFKSKFVTPPDHHVILDIEKDGFKMATIFTGLCNSFCCEGDALNILPVGPPDVTFVLDWTAAVVHDVLQWQCTTPNDRIRQFSVGLTLLYFLWQTRISFVKQLNCAINLLKLLAPQSTRNCDGKLVCHEFKFLQEQREELRITAFSELLKSMCSALILSEQSHPEWLYGVPLLHYLNWNIHPFEPVKVTLSTTEMRRLYADLPLSFQAEKMKKGTQFAAESAFSICQPLFELDHLLLWTYVVSSQFEDFFWILQQEPSSAPVVTALLSYVCKVRYKEHLTDSECAEISKLIDAVTNAVNILQKSEEISVLAETADDTMTDAVDKLETHDEDERDRKTLSAVQYSSIVLAGVEILDFLEERCGKKDKHIEVITAVIRLIFRGISGVMCKKEPFPALDEKTVCKDVHDALKKWLESPKVFGKSTFGKKEEIKIWKMILQVECPSVLLKRWQSLISELMEKRVDKLPPPDKLQQLKVNHLPGVVRSVLAKSVVKDIKRGNLRGGEPEIIKLFGDVDPIFTEVLGAYLKQQFIEGVILKDILTWNLWPTYLAFYTRHLPTVEKLETHIVPLIAERWEHTAKLLKLSAEEIQRIKHEHSTDKTKCCKEVLKRWLEGSGIAPKTWRKLFTVLELHSGLSPLSFSALPQEAEELCERALTIFCSVSHDIVTGKISLAKMEAIDKAYGKLESEASCPQQIILLHDACCSQRVQSLPPLDELDELKLCYQYRLLEYEHYCDKRKKLWLLSQQCSKISPDDCKAIETMVSDSSAKEKLSDVCRTRMEGSTKVYEFPCFEIADEVEQVLDPFCVMMQEKQTKFFTELWKKCVNDNSSEKKKPPLNLKEVPILFSDLYKKCERILEELGSLKIPLHKVRMHFSQMETPQEMEKEVHTLVDAVNKCRNKELKPIPYPKENALHKIKLYNQLCNFKEAGRTLIRLRKKLKLKDISVHGPEYLQGAAEFKEDHSLDVINESFVTTELKLLREIADASRRRRCLETFCDSYDLVEWVKTETTTISKMQNVVQIMLQSSSGDDGLVRDLLIDLLRVATAFASLIYDPIPKDASNDVLANRCSKLWKALEDTPDLSERLMNCNQHLQQFKHWWENAADMKQSTFRQMEAINTVGEYEISSKDGSIAHSVNEVVRLHVRGKGSESGMFRPTELEELQGKLVLIAGDKRDEVNKFLEIFHMVQHVAELLITLQQAGNARYIAFSLRFGCAKVDLERLESLIAEMENNLQVWQKQVEKFRKEYYCLNYFTTKQLLMLRAELKLQQQEKPSATLLSLLQCVSLLPTPSGIRQYLQNAQTNIACYLVPSSIKSETPSQRCSSVQILRLTESSLKEDQRRVFDSLRDVYPPMLVLRGIAESATADATSLRLWCIENEHEFISGEDVVSSHTESLSDVQVLDKTCDVVDENHPLVKVLVEEDKYTMDVAINAVKRCSSCIDGARRAAVEELSGGEVPPTFPKELELSSRYNLPTFIVSYDTLHSKYLELKEVGEFLKELSYPSAQVKDIRLIQRERNLSRFSAIERGSPNLLSVNTGGVWKTILSIYMQDDSMPLPTLEEVLICTRDTTLEEVTLLWHRAVNDPGRKRIFCLVHAEKLPYSVREQALQSLDKLTQGCTDYCIVIICTKSGQEWSHILSRLAPFHRSITHVASDVDIAMYLKQHFVQKGAILQANSATIVDEQRCCVRLVFSTAAGMGKTLHVQRLVEDPKLCDRTKKHHAPLYVRIPIHGPDVSPDIVMRHLEQHSQDPNAPFPQILHFDVACSALPRVADVLFSILVLGGLFDSHGKVWRHQPSQLLVVECTLTSVTVDLQNCKWHRKQKVAADRNASTLSLLSLLPSIYCISPTEVKTCEQETLGMKVLLMDEGIHKSEPVQRVYQYLRRLKSKVSLDHFSYKVGSVEGTPATCLALLLQNIQPSNKRPSWSEVSHFVNFLNIQLQDCETSIYCNQSLVGEDLPYFKDFVTKFIVQMSQEFTAPSLKAAASDDSSVSNLEEAYNFGDQHAWISRKHPYLFFNEDHNSMTFMGFSIDDKGNLVDPNTRENIQRGIMSPVLRDALQRQRVNFEEDYNSWTSDKMLLKLASILGCSKLNGEQQAYVENPDPTYVLTYDNVMKMLAIHMRFRCNIPVIMMGETGCGKTRLLRYLCDLQRKNHGLQNLICLKVHGGTTPDQITAVVNKARGLARENEKKLKEDAKQKHKEVHTILFFDEANTTEALELIKEIICDRCVNGEPIKENLKFAAACNPYRRHTEEMLTKLRSAGLGFYDLSRLPVIGTAKPYELVYRVLELPPAMQRLVYDFGQISGETEKMYIRRIVQNHVRKNQHVRDAFKKDVENVAFEVLSFCQQYMREQKDECSFVSLRDVIRALDVFEWFLQIMKEGKEFGRLLRNEEEDEEEKYKCQIQPLKRETRSLVLAVAVCYHARLSDEDNRQKFHSVVVEHFLSPYKIVEGPKRFRKEIERCQMVFLKQMMFPKNIAHNAALRENVFMMVVCIENCLPLFLVGKPGSSKSLAKSIVANSMTGHNSPKQLLRNFKQVQIFPYQCSQYSTAKSVLDVFEESKKFQERMDPARFVSVVVLEEVGLAEASPELPLKVLHPFLEDGTAGLNLDEDEIQSENRVAFIGISNWALDPAKMNRGIMVVRVPLNDNELVVSAEGIAESLAKSPEEVKKTDIQVNLKTFFQPLAEMYRALCQKQLLEATGDDTDIEGKREFFGLRDFYSLIKMLCSMCLDTQKPLTWLQLEHAIRRNFSGLKGFDPIEYLPNQKNVMDSCRLPDPDEFQPSCTSLGLIQASTMSHTFADKKHEPDEEAVKAYSDNRYLLLLTENNSALNLLDSHLFAESGESPFVLYGSSFRRDLEYTQVCRNINQIKVHMETGKPVVLLNLENIYESLYDLLNQCYTELPRGRYVDLGLRTHRIKCRVHENFRLIIIADATKVSKEFPTALINRMEKHFLVSSSILNSRERQIANEIGDWAKQFATVKPQYGIRCATFEEGDAFVGFQKDTVASIVLHSMQLLKQEATVSSSELLTSEVKERSKYLLLQLASQDSIARLSTTELGADKESSETYFDKQKHASLAGFIKHYIHNPDFAKMECLHSQKGTLLQVTTYGLLLSHVDVKTIVHEVEMGEHDIQLLMLQEFDTEIDFSRKIRKVFQKAQRLLIVECDNGHKNSDLIACARYRLVDERDKTNGITQIVFVIQLPRVICGTSFASFQGGAWISAHIDDLKGSEATTSLLKVALNEPISKFFKTIQQKPSPAFKPTVLLRNCVQKAVSELISPQFKQRAEDLVELLLLLISPEWDNGCSGDFTDVLMERLSALLEEKDESMPYLKEWALRDALNGHKLQCGYTLINTLSSTLQHTIQEVLTYIIFCIDCNNNLSLIDPKSQTSPLSQIWIAAFQKPTLVRLHFDDLFTSKANASTFLSSSKYRYRSQFPFSWLIISEIESLRSTTLSQHGKIEEHFTSLCDAAAQHVVDKVLNVANPKYMEDMRTRYLHDFCLELVIKTDDEEQMMELLQDSVAHVASGLLTVHTLTMEVVAIHASYHAMRNEIYWMMQLLKHFPGLAVELKKIPGVTEKMLLPWHAVKLIMEKLSPYQVEMLDNSQRKEWMQNIHLCKNVMESLLACSTSNDEAAELQLEARKTWLRILTVLLYVEHIVIKLPTSLPSLDILPKRLFDLITPLRFSEGCVLQWIIALVTGNVKAFKKYKNVPNLICQSCKERTKLSETTVVPCSDNHMFCADCLHSARDGGYTKCPKCEEVLLLIDEPDIPHSMRKQLEEYSNLQQRFRDFFMEFVAQICFSPASPEPPDETFIKQLLHIAIDLGDPKYGELLPIAEELCSETVSVMQSFLVQFVFEFSPTVAKECLDIYLQKGERDVGKQFLKDNIDLYLVCARSIESGHFKEYSMLQSLEKCLQYASEKLSESIIILGDHKAVKEHSKAMDIVYLESIAKARFGFCITAEILHDFVWNPKRFDALRYKEKAHIAQLIVRSHQVCDRALMGLNIDLRHFLIKQIVRQYGFSCWNDVKQDNKMRSWIAPSNIQSADPDGIKSTDLDPFMMYGTEYHQLHQILIYSSADVKECLKESEVLQHTSPVLLLFALYKRAFTQLPQITKSHRRTIHVLQQLRYWVHDCQLFTPNVNAAIAGCDFQQTQTEPPFSPWESFTEKYLAEIVVHTFSVLSSKPDDSLLQLLALPFTNPALLRERYVPTMPDEVFEEALRIFVHETAWECPNGHKYLIGNCGRPWVTAKCPVPGCGATIGGIWHEASPETTKIDRDSAADFITTGYILGIPERRNVEPVSWRERDLGQESYTIIRILLHASCVWGTLSLNKEHLKALSRSVNPPVNEKDLLNYFWHHMEKDLEILAKTTGKEEQDAALIVHCILQHIFNSKETAEHGAQYACFTSEERNKWENAFDAAFVQPIYQDLNERLGEAQKALIDDTSEEQAELFKIVSEQDIKKRADDVDSQLWSYHPKIGPCHLSAALHKYKGPPLKLLDEFLQKELRLRALQYLPDIVQLQMSLHEICNCRFDEADAKEMKMHRFIEHCVPREHYQKGFCQMVKSFCKAWNTVKGFLPLPVENQDVEMSEEQTLAHFIPSKNGSSVCLATYLARLQNDMIEYAWTKSDEYGTSNRQYRVPLNQIQKCHVIDHEQHFEHTILSHCSYSLMAGYGDEIVYDFPALEKHILDRFLLGKPSIAPVSIPAVLFKGDVLKTNKFAQVRSNIPQVYLSQQQKQDIIEEVTQYHRLQTTLYYVSVALGFLTYTTWTKNALLSRYIFDVLKIPNPFTPEEKPKSFISKVEQYCTVGHAISLWRTLSVENGRQCTLAGQDPFPEVDSTFKAPLNEDEKAKLEVCLKQFELDQFLESIFEFITTHVQHLQEGDGEHEMGLVERYADQVVIYKIDEFPDLERNFPEDILLSKVVEVWKYAVKYQAKNKEQE